MIISRFLKKIDKYDSIREKYFLKIVIEIVLNCGLYLSQYIKEDKRISQKYFRVNNSLAVITDFNY